MTGKVEEGKSIIEKISGLKYELTRDRPLNTLNVTADNASTLGNSKAPTTESFDAVISSTQPSWHNADWLFTECYLYRRLRLLFETSKNWQDYDPFMQSKVDTFRASGRGIHACATWIEELLSKSSNYKASEPGTGVLFQELMSSSLWGNATDLSLLTNVDYTHLQKLQATSHEERSAKAAHLLVNDLPKVWNKVRMIQEGRVDIVLDNAGFELITDLLLADFLLTLRAPIATASKGRSDELEKRVSRVKERISNVCKQAQVKKEPRFLAVSKLHPPSDIMSVYERTGQRHFGENYVQELVEKSQVLPEDIQWHFIGGLQSNKAKLLGAVPNLYLVESVDSEKLAMGLQKAVAKPENAARRTKPLNIFIQVNTSGEEGKSGLPAMTEPWSGEGEKPVLLAVAQKVMLSCPHLRFQGLMTIGSLTNSQASQGASHRNPDFDVLVASRKHLSEALRRDTAFTQQLASTKWWTPSGEVSGVYEDLSDTSLELSMGMSSDLEAAIRIGSTNVRIGSDCFGSRSSNAVAADVRAAEMKRYEDMTVVKEVVFHPKTMPWFVSVRMRWNNIQDTCVKDVWFTLDQLLAEDFFTGDHAVPSMTPIHSMARRWREHFDAGRFRLSMPSDAPLGASVGPLGDFWTQPESYGHLPEAAPALLAELQSSDLVIFKGTLAPCVYLHVGDLVRHWLF